MPTVEELIKKYEKTYKSSIFHQGLPQYSFERIPFTSPTLNFMTFGGLPVGTLCEFYGQEHGGKTTTALDVVANYQNMETEKRVLYADCENTLDVVWAKKLGVDVDSLLLIQPENQSAEQIFDMILEIITTGEIGLVVIDSLGVMVSQQAWDKSLEEKTYAGISKVLTDFSKKAVQHCKKYQCTIIGINQIRDNLNSMFGGTTTTGGHGWQHDCIVRLEFRRGKFFDHNGKDLTRGAANPAGNYVEVDMIKNKSCPPTRRKQVYTLRYATGIDYLSDLIEVALSEEFGIIVQTGAWYSIVNPETGEQLEKLQGKSGVYSFLENEENMEVLSTIETWIDERIQVEA